MFMNFMSSGGCLPLPWGYIHVYDHNNYSNIFSEAARPAKYYVENHSEGGTKVCINRQGYMTKMATMAINSKIV